MDSFTGQDPEARDFGIHAPAPPMPAVHTLVSLGFPLYDARTLTPAHLTGLSL